MNTDPMVDNQQLLYLTLSTATKNSLDYEMHSLVVKAVLLHKALSRGFNPWGDETKSA